MLHKLLGLSPVLVLLLALFVTPALCARGRLGLHYFHHAQHHHLHQLPSPKTNTDPNNLINIHMVTDKEEEGSIEPNSFMWAPGHMAITNNVEVPAGDESIGGLRPAQVADSMSIMGTPNLASMSDEPKTSGSVSGPNLGPNPTAIKRSLLDPLSNSDDTLQGLFLASWTNQKDNNLFSMLPRAQRVPPSGPSKNHNSELTDNHS